MAKVKISFYKVYNIEINVACCVDRVEIEIREIYKKVGVLPIRIVKFNVSSIGPSSERNIKLPQP